MISYVLQQLPHGNDWPAGFFGNYLSNTRLKPRDKLKTSQLVLIRVSSARPISHVADVVEMAIADVRQNSREVRPTNQFPIVDLLEVFLGLEFF